MSFKFEEVYGVTAENITIMSP